MKKITSLFGSILSLFILFCSFAIKGYSVPLGLLCFILGCVGLIFFMEELVPFLINKRERGEN